MIDWIHIILKTIILCGRNQAGRISSADIKWIFSIWHEQISQNLSCLLFSFLCSPCTHLYVVTSLAMNSCCRSSFHIFTYSTLFVFKSFPMSFVLSFLEILYISSCLLIFYSFPHFLVFSLTFVFFPFYYVFNSKVLLHAFSYAKINL